MQPHEIPSTLKNRLVADVRARALISHEKKLMAWASSNDGPLPTLDEATAEEWIASQIVISVLGPLALHPPEELFLGLLFQRPGPETDWLDGW